MEQPDSDGGAIPEAVSCHPGCLHGPLTSEINGEGQVEKDEIVLSFYSIVSVNYSAHKL